MEHGDSFSSCMKIGEKTINVKGKVKLLIIFVKNRRHFHANCESLPQVTGDFIVEECEVDGNIASQMKQILVRQ